MQLIDWAMRNGRLCDWVIFQHCDFFWEEKDWFPKIQKVINSNPKVLTIKDPWDSKHIYLDGEPIHCFHDHFAIYNRKMVVEQDLYFDWGVIKHAKFSDKARKAIQESRFQWGPNHPNKQVSQGHGDSNPEVEAIMNESQGLDGSDAIAIETSLRFPDAIMTIPVKFTHYWEVFRYTEWSKLKGNVFSCNASFDEHSAHFLVQHSAFTSFIFDFEEVKNCILPWCAMEFLLLKYDRPDLFWSKEKVLKLLKYKTNWMSPLGGKDCLGVDVVRLRDVIFPLTIKFY